ncbi:MAG: hypothetical protein GKS00_21935 [Alphaproteobacteria bacterium]|nr:hypothetical protein [Alphaproteobacteria bacterium]
MKKQDINKKIEWSAAEVFLGLGAENGGAVFVSQDSKLVRLEPEGPAFRAIMLGVGGARKARREAAKATSF